MLKTEHPKQAVNALQEDSTSSKPESMGSPQSQCTNLESFKESELRFSELTKQPQLFSDNNFIMWENNSNICWLDASMALLVHNETMRRVIKLNPDCLVSKITKSYDEAISILNNNSSNKAIMDRLSDAREVLQKVQEISLKYLQPLIKCKKGEPDSAFCSLLNLIKEDKLIQGFFGITFAWCRLCDNCGLQRVLTSTKPIITIANVTKFVPENHVSPTSCPICQEKDQTMKLVYKKLPACLIFHFENGAGNGDNPPLNFLVSSRKYELSSVMILEKGQESNVNHFVTYVRNPSTEKWLECNDLNMDITPFVAEQPDFDLKDVYIYVYEAFDDLGTIEIEEDSLLSNSHHNIPCIDISEEESVDNADIDGRTPENKKNDDLTENVENIENITAFLSETFKENDNALAVSTANTDSVSRKTLDPSNISSESSNISKNIASWSKQNTSSFIASSSSHASFSESPKNICATDILSRIPSEKISASIGSGLGTKRNVSQSQEQKSEPVLNPATRSIGGFIDIDKFINHKLHEIEEKSERGKKSLFSLSSCSNQANNVIKANNIEHPIASVRKKHNELSKVHLNEKRLEQFSKSNNTKDNCIENKEYDKVTATENMDSSPKKQKNPVKLHNYSPKRNKINIEDVENRKSELNMSREENLSKQDEINTSNKLLDKKSKLSPKKDLDSKNSILDQHVNLTAKNRKRKKSPSKNSKGADDKFEDSLGIGGKVLIDPKNLLINKKSIKEKSSHQNEDLAIKEGIMDYASNSHFSKKKNYLKKLSANEIEFFLSNKKESIVSERCLEKKKSLFCDTLDKIRHMSPIKKKSDLEQSENFLPSRKEFLTAKKYSKAKEPLLVDTMDKKRHLTPFKKKTDYEEQSVNENYLYKRESDISDRHTEAKKTLNDSELYKERLLNSPDKVNNSKSTNKESPMKENSLRMVKGETDDHQLILKMHQTSLKKTKDSKRKSSMQTVPVHASASNNESVFDVNQPSCSYTIKPQLKNFPKSRNKKSNRTITELSSRKKVLEIEYKNKESKIFKNKSDNVLSYSPFDGASSLNNENVTDKETSFSSNSEIDNYDIPKSKDTKPVWKVRFNYANKSSKKKKNTAADESDGEKIVYKGKKKTLTENGFSSENNSPGKRIKLKNALNSETLPISSHKNFLTKTSLSNCIKGIGDDTSSCGINVDDDFVLDTIADSFLKRSFDLFHIT